MLRKSTSATVTVGAPPACTGTVVTHRLGAGHRRRLARAPGRPSPSAAPSSATTRAPARRCAASTSRTAGDGNPSTSDGIFVFDNGANLVSLGDVVQVTGPVSEFQGQTQLTAAAAASQSCGRQATVDPHRRDPAGGRGRRPSSVTRACWSASTRRSSSPSTSSSAGSARSSSPRATGCASRPPTSAPPTRPRSQAAQHANDLNRLIIDDALQSQNPDPIIFGRAGQPLSASNTLRGGDTVTDPVGVMTYTWAGNAASGNAYRLRPIGALGGTAVFDAGQPAADGAAGGRHRRDQDRQRQPAQLLQHLHRLPLRHHRRPGRLPRCLRRHRVPAAARQGGRLAAVPRRRRDRLHGDGERRLRPEQRGAGAGRTRSTPADGPGAWAFVDPDAATGVVDVGRDRRHQGRACSTGPRRCGRWPARRSSTRTRSSSGGRSPRPSRPRGRAVHRHRQPLQVQGLVPGDRPRHRPGRRAELLERRAARRRPTSWPQWIQQHGRARRRRPGRGHRR